MTAHDGTVLEEGTRVVYLGREDDPGIGRGRHGKVAGFLPVNNLVSVVWDKPEDLRGGRRLICANVSAFDLVTEK